jgi:hypothetical protein
MRDQVLKLNTKPIQRCLPVPIWHAPFFAYYFFGSACKIEATPHTNCRVKRHLQTISIHEHGSHTETKPDSTILTHHPNTLLAKASQGHKLYSKVLTIEPNRLLSKYSLFDKGA